jgi:hypothetical protein
MIIVAGCPVSPMALPEELITDWVGRAGNREKLRELELMFAVKPDMALLDEFLDDAVKASRSHPAHADDVLRRATQGPAFDDPSPGSSWKG